MVLSHMRLFAWTLFASLLAGGASAAQARLPTAGISVAAGLAPVRASTPYSSSLAAFAGVAVATRVGPQRAVELEGVAFGALTPADVYVVGQRELPNTLGVAARVSQLVGRRGQWSVGAGVGRYRIARRTEAGGGAGAGYHVVVTRFGPGAVTADVRLILVPSIAGARMWVLPVTVGLRTR